MKKHLIILVFGFDQFQVNFVSKRPGAHEFSISFMYDLAYDFLTPKDAASAINLLSERYIGLRYEIIEANCLNFKR